MANLCTTLETLHNTLLSDSDTDSDEVVKLRTNTVSHVSTRRHRQESSSSDGRSSTDRMFIPKRGCNFRSTSCDSRRHPGRPEYIRCRCCGKLKKARVSFSDEVEDDIESKNSLSVTDRTQEQDTRSSIRSRAASCDRGNKPILAGSPGLEPTGGQTVSVLPSKALPTYEEFVRARGRHRRREQGLPPQIHPSDPARLLQQGLPPQVQQSDSPRLLQQGLPPQAQPSDPPRLLQQGLPPQAQPSDSARLIQQGLPLHAHSSDPPRLLQQGLPTQAQPSDPARLLQQGLPPQAPSSDPPRLVQHPSDPARLLPQQTRRRCSSPFSPQRVQPLPGRVPPQYALHSSPSSTSLSTSLSRSTRLPPPLNSPSFKSSETPAHSSSPAHVLSCNIRNQVSEFERIENPAFGRNHACEPKLGRYPCIQALGLTTEGVCDVYPESLPIVIREVAACQSGHVGSDGTSTGNEHKTDVDVEACSENGLFRSSPDKFVLEPEVAFVSSEVFSHSRSHVSETGGPAHQSSSSTAEHFTENTSNTSQAPARDSRIFQSHQATYPYNTDQGNSHTSIQTTTLFSRPPKIPNKRSLYTSKRLQKSNRDDCQHTNFASMKYSLIQQGTESRFGCSESELQLRPDSDIPPVLPPKPRISNHCSSVDRSSPPQLPPRAGRPPPIDTDGAPPRAGRPPPIDTDGAPPIAGRPLPVDSVDTSLNNPSKDPERDNHRFILEILV